MLLLCKGCPDQAVQPHSDLCGLDWQSQPQIKFACVNMGCITSDGDNRDPPGIGKLTKPTGENLCFLKPVGQVEHNGLDTKV
jgi:hypothetical protein